MTWNLIITYKYEVLGELHTFLAKSQPAQEIPDKDMYKVMNTKVYVGLRDDAVPIQE